MDSPALPRTVLGLGGVKAAVAFPMPSMVVKGKHIDGQVI
jgi:hypothetical protein